LPEPRPADRCSAHLEDVETEASHGGLEGAAPKHRLGGASTGGPRDRYGHGLVSLPSRAKLPVVPSTPTKGQPTNAQAAAVIATRRQMTKGSACGHPLGLRLFLPLLAVTELATRPLAPTIADPRRRQGTSMRPTCGHGQKAVHIRSDRGRHELIFAGETVPGVPPDVVPPAVRKCPSKTRHAAGVGAAGRERGKLDLPDTGTGMELSTPVPSPSAPDEFDPQQ